MIKVMGRGRSGLYRQQGDRVTDSFGVGTAENHACHMENVTYHIPDARLTEASGRSGLIDVIVHRPPSP